MSSKYNELSAALAAFDPEYTLKLDHRGDVVPTASSFDEIISEMVPLMVAGKSLYMPQPVAPDGEYQCHLITIREPGPDAQRPGKMLFQASIYGPNEGNLAPINGALIAAGIIAVAANTAQVLREHHAAEAALKKDLAPDAAAIPGAEPAADNPASSS